MFIITFLSNSIFSTMFLTTFSTDSILTYKVSTDLNIFIKNVKITGTRTTILELNNKKRCKNNHVQEQQF